MKQFDVVVGNPPYQKPKNYAHPSQELWPVIVERCISVLSPSGIIAMITPSSWFKSSANIQRRKEKGGNINILNDFFKKGHLISADLNTIKYRGYFANIGRHITWWIFKKTATVTPKQTKFYYWDNGIKSFVFDISNIKSIPVHGYPYSFSILEKVQNKVGKKWQFNHFRKEITSNISDCQDSKFKYPIAMSTAAKSDICQKYGLVIRYTKVKQSHFNSAKVIIPYLSESGFVPVVTDLPLNTNYCAVQLIGKNQVESAKSVFHSKLYRLFFTMKNGQHSEVAPLNEWTALPLDKIYSDNDIYTFYNLDEKEIDYIENAIK